MRAALLRFVIRAACSVSWPAAERVGTALGLLAYHVLRFRRSQIEESLALAFDRPRGDPWIAATTRSNFIHYGLLVVELLRLRKLTAANVESLVEYRGMDHVDAALRKGKGVLALTAHLGNHDLIACAFALRGYSLTIISKDLKNKAVGEVWMNERTASGLRIVPHRDSLREILKALRSNGCVGFVLDQHARKDNVWVDFFGRPASTLSSLAVLAARTGAPVVPIFGRRIEQGRHVIEAHPEIPLDEPADTEEAIIRNTSRFSDAIEAAIRAVPDQWTWIHRRWKQPPAPADGC